MKVNIFVEGNDANFLEQYIHFLFPEIDRASYQIIPTKGVTNLSKVSAYFIENTENDKGVNLVIFDADDPSKDFGGFEIRTEYIELQKRDLGIEFESFLFPNNEDNGDYESLLEQIINPDHRCLFTCFEGYQACINSKTNDADEPIYNSPIRKTKIYAYIDSIRKSKELEDRFKKRIKNAPKGDDYLFDIPEIWNLNAAYLDKLKAFLSKHFQPAAD